MSDWLLTPAEEAFREDVRAFLGTALNEQVARELAEHGEHSPSFYRSIAERGWLGLQWPQNYGGMGLGHVHSAVLFEEAGFAQAPVLAYSITSIIGNALISMSPHHAAEFLPRISRGEVIICLGYSEPNAGSDLASLQTRAVRHNDEYVVNGSKIFTSIGHVANYMFLAARTGTTEDRHRGVSVFVLNLTSPGVTIEPLMTIDGMRANVVYFDDVRIPAEAVVLGENQGWKVLENALAHERVGAVALRIGEVRRLLGHLVGRTDREQALADRLLLTDVGQLLVELEAARVMVYNLARQSESGGVTSVAPAMIKLYATELFERATLACVRHHGLNALATDLSLFARDVQDCYLRSVRFTVTAGTSEVQRNLIAQRGLGLPR